MRLQKKRWLALTIGAAAAALAVADVVELYPAYLTGTLQFTGDPGSFYVGGPFGQLTTTSYYVAASPESGSTTWKTVPAADPTSYSLTLDGGASSETNPGRKYRPHMTAYFAAGASANASLAVYRSTQITLKNEPTSNPDQDVADFIYAGLRAIDARVEVQGGTLTNVSFYASAASADSLEYYSASAWRSYQTPPSSGSAWLAMVARPSVSVIAYANVRSPSGSVSLYSLPAQTVDLSQAAGSASWTINLNDTAPLTVNASVTTSGITSMQLQFSGVSGTPTQGVIGSATLDLPASGPATKTINLPPGDYNVYLRSNFNSQYADSSARRITLPTGGSTELFGEAWGTAEAPLAVTGLFQAADVDSASYLLQRTEVGVPFQTNAQRYGAPASSLSLQLGQGSWRPSYTSLHLYDFTDPNFPLNAYVQRSYESNDVARPAQQVLPGLTTTFAAESFELVKTNLFLDVREPAGTPTIKAYGPQVNAYKQDYNPDGTYKGQTYLYAYGNNTESEMPVVTLVGEPGTYTLDAGAYVNGTFTRFPLTSITFAKPVVTPPGPNVKSVLTPVDQTDPVIWVVYDQVGTGGVSSVVTSPIGPTPPSGLQSYCEEAPPPEPGEDPYCETTYYDIKTTADWRGTDPTTGEPRLATVCVRFTATTNAPLEWMRLYHYEEEDANNDGETGWEALPPPEGMDPVVSCDESPVTCGCPETGCPASDGPVFLVCGRTSSFSAFVPFIEPRAFDNVVDGSTYTGRNGPPLGQRFTVPATGDYRITAIGASGGRPTATPALTGGCGAELSGVFTLQEGDVIEVVVGQQGGSGAKSAGGGGGTFVAKNQASGPPIPLIIAGGGGGVRYGGTVSGRDASLTTAGVPGSTSATYTSGFIAGGVDGLGGARQATYGSGGGGWSGNGANDGTYGEGGFSFLTAGAARARGGAGKACLGTNAVDLAEGGYGGGGSGNGCWGGGGGGGYSGGGGGRVAGGGGSYNAGTRQTTPKIHACQGGSNGSVHVKFLSASQ